MDARTVGVEEELFLVDPETRLSSPRSPQVLQHAAQDPGADGDDLDREFFRHQVETRTPPTASMAELRDHLVRGRRLAADAAEAAGLATVASGTVPTANHEPRVTTDDRYLDIMGRYGEIARPGGTCGMHVHVHVESPEVGVDVIDARLARDHPTVEVRISDVCTDPDDAVLIAALLRAMVGRAADLAQQGADDSADHERVAAGRSADFVWRAELLRAAQWRAARYGLSGQLLDPTTGELDRAPVVLDRLLEVAGPRLEVTGDTELVRQGLRRALGESGASRQRAALERGGGLDSVVDDLVERTNAAWRG